MKGIIVPIEMPSNCALCPFVEEPQELYIEPGIYKKISKCKFCPDSMEDGWRSLVWQIENKETWCPLKTANVEAKSDRT